MCACSRSPLAKALFPASFAATAPSGGGGGGEAIRHSVYDAALQGLGCCGEAIEKGVRMRPQGACSNL